MTKLKKKRVKRPRRGARSIAQTIADLQPRLPQPEVVKPLTVAQAWDAMKDANALPRCYENAPVNPFLPVEKIIVECDPTLDWTTECRHEHPDGKLCIFWQENVDDSITGVCAHCFEPFNTKNPEHLELFKRRTSKQWMGVASKARVTPRRELDGLYGTRYQIFMQLCFPWVYRVQVWWRNKYPAIKKWVKTDF